MPHSWEGATGYLETVELAQATRPRQRVGGGVDKSPRAPGGHRADDPDLQRLALVVDSANGAGAAIDPAAFVFMNTDTAMHLHRAPVGNDFALRAKGSIGPDGIGVTTAEIFDRQGFIGTCAQTLFVPAASASLYIACVYIDNLQYSRAWMYSKRSPNRAGARCWTCWPAASERRANSSPRCPP